MLYVVRFFEFRNGRKTKDHLEWVFLRYKTMKYISELFCGGKLTRLGNGWSVTMRSGKNGFSGYYIERRPFWNAFGWRV